MVLFVHKNESLNVGTVYIKIDKDKDEREQYIDGIHEPLVTKATFNKEKKFGRTEKTKREITQKSEFKLFTSWICHVPKM